MVLGLMVFDSMALHLMVTFTRWLGFSMVVYLRLITCRVRCCAVERPVCAFLLQLGTFSYLYQTFY